MSRKTQDFQTIRSEGGLLPPDLLRRILDPRGNLPGTAPEDYGLPPGERLNESITQSWNRLRKHWSAFSTVVKNQAQPEPEDGSAALTGLTNDKWTLPLLRELGFGLLPTSAGPEVGGRTYPISRFFGPVPIHLIGCGLSLDKRAAGQRGAAAVNPHGLVQDFLNRSEGHLWAILSNGMRLRILRDNQSLSRQSYLEFDLEAMFDGEVFSDFAILWLTAHATRFMPEQQAGAEGGGKPADVSAASCWLEKWTKKAEEQGARALESLKDSVVHALQTLGEGFTSHPRNTALRDALRNGELKPADFHGQLLRVIYRLIFLFVAEDRTLDGISLLHIRETGENETDLEACYSLYASHYSTARLREMAGKIKGSRHGDLWEQFNLIVGALSGGEQFAEVRNKLALPTFGSFLWDPSATSSLNAGILSDDKAKAVTLSNHDFLEALRHLAFIRQGRILRPVDYRNIGAEELGGIYESLLELTPQISADGARFAFAEFSGNERKTSGSYYTPDSLVQCLLDSALDPVVKERMASSERRAEHVEELTDQEKQYVYQILSRLGSMAEGDGVGRSRLQDHKNVSEGGSFRNDVSDSAGGILDSRQHCGGMGPGDDKRVSAIPPHSAGQPTGTGNPSHSGRTCGTDQPGTTIDGGSNHSGASVDSVTTKPYSETQFLKLWSITPLAARRSLLAEKALLSLRVCDPAVGSGHFLVAAAHRLARHLARVRALAQGESEPSPLLYQHALRDVIGRCLYGVDINPMAAELCRVSLWLEALDPGKPLSFLDHHIQCGNSLIGATPGLMARGIPDEAFTPIQGDDKKYCAEFKKINKSEARNQEGLAQATLFDREDQPWHKLGNLAAAMVNFDNLPDNTPADIQAKEKQYYDLIRGATYASNQQLADAWCAAFVWKKCKPADGGFDYPITNEMFQRMERNPFDAPVWMRDEIKRLAGQYKFFHWHLAFPDVFQPEERRAVSGEQRAEDLRGWRGGFDVILGNPPWEHTELKEKEWFAERSPEIANANTGSERKKMIQNLRSSEPELFLEFSHALRHHDAISHFCGNSGLYSLCGRGRLNYYALFAELFRNRLAPGGRFGAVLPSGIATDDTTKFFFQNLVETCSLVSFYDFENKNLFPTVHSSYKFCLLTAGSGSCPAADSAEFAFFCHSVNDLREPGRRFLLTPEDIALLNPNTRTCPIFRSTADAELTKAIYRRVPILIREARDGQPEENPWGIKFKQGLFNMTSDSHLFRTREQLESDGLTLDGNVFRRRAVSGEQRVEGANSDRSPLTAHGSPPEYLPLYEAKMIHHFDHRWATYDGLETRDLTLAEKQNPNHFAIGRYWVRASDVQSAMSNAGWDRQWLMGWRDITNTTNERTVIFSLLPLIPVGHTCPIMFSNDTPKNICLATANLAAFIHDFYARQKVGGTHLTYGYLNQLPVLPTAAIYHSALAIHHSILELTYTAWDLEPFAKDCGYDGPPFRWDENRRYEIRCELDAAFFHLYLPTEANGEWKLARKSDGCPYDETPEQLAELKKHFPTPRHAVDYIMDTFPIVKRKDEEKFGEYRTKKRILEIYDAMAAVMKANAGGRMVNGELRMENGQDQSSLAAHRLPLATYRSRLNPPPGPPSDAAGNFLPLPEWKPGQPKPTDWPPHIHPPKGCDSDNS